MYAGWSLQFINLKAWGCSTQVLLGSLLMAQWICHHIAIHTGVTVVVNNETIVYSGVETCEVWIWLTKQVY